MPPEIFTLSYNLHDNEETQRDVKNSSNCATELIADTAVDIIGKSDKSKPFLMVLSLSAADDDLLQPSDDEVERFDYIADSKRRRVAARVSRVDESVGRLVESLKVKGALQKTIILFVSTGGDSGSNFPLRGVS